jgi:6-phosphogluconolactonase
MASGLIYVGTHRRAHRADPVDIAFGIYWLRMASDTGQLSSAGLIETPQPGWLSMHPGGRSLYAVNEVQDFDGVQGGGVSAFAIAPETGALTLLNARPTSSLPCHCEVDASGKYLLVATFGGGAVHLFPLEPDGQIGPEADFHQHTGSSAHPRRQTGPHAHGISIDPGNRFVLVPDLGTDQVIVYELDHQAGHLIPRPERNVRLPPESGPRHLVFDQRSRFAYLMNEMSATIAVFSYEAGTAALQEIQTVDTLPAGFVGLRSGAEIALHPSGRFLYASTRSHGSSGALQAPGLDRLVWFEVEEAGTLRSAGSISSGGQIPRTFTFDSRGDVLFVGHQCSGTVVTFQIDRATGTPIATGTIISSPVPVCLRFTRGG